MQDYYLSRIVSGSYLRPGLLLGSAGLVLGATLLLFLAADNGATARVAWPTPTETGAGAPLTELNRSVVTTLATELVAEHATIGQQPALLRKPYPAKKQANLEPEPATNRPGPALAPTYAASVGGPVRLVQHSWDTIKSMFR